MSNKKLISIRVEEDALTKIEKMISNYGYYNRSDVINGLLRIAADVMSPKQIVDCIRYDSRFYDIEPINITITRKERKS